MTIYRACRAANAMDRTHFAMTILPFFIKERDIHFSRRLVSVEVATIRSKSAKHPF